MSILRRITNLFRRSKLDQEIEAELRLHIEMRTADNMAAGMSPEEARRNALLRFGNRAVLKERVTAADLQMFLDSAWQDLCYSLRALRKSPGFTAVAVLTLALGIGANTAIFSMVNGILLRALPYVQPTQLYSINEFIPQLSAYGPRLPVTGGNFLAWKNESYAFSTMALIDAEGSSLLGMGRPQWLYGAGVTPELFSILSVQPAMGPAFLSTDGISAASLKSSSQTNSGASSFTSIPTFWAKSQSSATAT
jgi:macrolide transport system ATP-binding/permease protein